MAPQYNVIKTGIESNGYQTLFAQHAKNEDLQVVEINNVRKKETRIEGLEPLVSSGKILFREDWRCLSGINRTTDPISCRKIR